MLTPQLLEPVDPTTAAAFETLLEAKAGQRLGLGRQWRIATALTPIAEQLGLPSLADLARAAAMRPAIAAQVVDALVNGESSFFRDAAAFTLVRDLLPPLAAVAPGRALRLWSAGCSAGQEALSLAILAAEAELRAEIVATDVSPAAISRARTGRFSQFEIQRGLSVHRMMRWFEGKDSDWTANSTLLSTIRFRVATLTEPMPGATGFDLILCRNVLFYLTPDARRVAVHHLQGALRPGGLLILGAGETLIGDAAGFQPSTRFRGAYEALRPATLAARGRAA